MNKLIATAERFQGKIFSEVDATEMTENPEIMAELRHLTVRLGGQAIGSKRNIFLFPFEPDCLQKELSRINSTVLAAK